MSLALNTSKWSQTLWRSHLTHSQPARHLVSKGTMRQGAFPDFADDVHGALYLRLPPEALPEAPAWATDLLTQAQGLAEWKPLKARCLASGFQAGVATETVLRALVALTPQAEDPPPDPGDTRRALRRALRQAGTDVDGAVEALEALMPGGAGPLQEHAQGSLVALEQVRELYDLLQHNSVMQQMAEMAGRLERLVARHKKAQAVAQIGAITGVTIGGDLARILPSELAGLRGGRLARLGVLAKLQGRKALQYDVWGETPEVRGPVIVLLDKSGSMSSEQIAWEAAVGLTLLTLCQAQGRTWALLNFADQLHDETVVEPGAGVTPALCQALCHDTGGSTDFDKPLARALALLQHDARLGNADVFFLTDGKPNDGCGPSEATLAGLQALREAEGLSIFGIGIGASARLETIQAIATETFHLSSRPHDDQGALVPLLAQIV